MKRWFTSGKSKMFLRLKSQFATSNDNLKSLSLQIETSNHDSLRLQSATLDNGRGRHSKYLPYVFAEEGVAMLSGMLNSDKAISMNIAIMRALVEVRIILLLQNDLKEQLKEVKESLGGHGAQLTQIYDAMENVLDEKEAERKWKDRERIGFKKIKYKKDNRL
jgi:hypothetical protein